jgi:ABC-type antimicrobial peptide transport system permease subunit
MIGYILSQFRYRGGRTLGVIIGIALGAALYVVLTSLGGAFLRAASLPLKGVAADLVLTRPAMGSATSAETQRTRGPRLPFGNGIFRPSDLKIISATQGVAAWSGSLEVWDFGENSYKTILGIDQTQDQVGPMVGLKAGLVSGRLIQAGDSDGVVADRHFAALFGIKPGDSLRLGDRDYRVVGVAEQKESSQAGVANLYVPLRTAETLAGVSEGEVNQVYARLSDASRTDEIVKSLSTRLGKLSAVSQQSILQVMGGVSRVTARFSAAAGLLGALGGIALAWAALSGLMAERRREIGIMKAVGWRTRDIVRTFISESAILSVCGGIAGTVIGLVLALVLAGLPSPAPALHQQIPGLAAAPIHAASMTLPIEISPAMLALALLISVAGGTLTGWLGARKAAGVRTAQVLRND